MCLITFPLRLSSHVFNYLHFTSILTVLGICIPYHLTYLYLVNPLNRLREKNELNKMTLRRFFTKFVNLCQWKSKMASTAGHFIKYIGPYSKANFLESDNLKRI